MLVGVSEEVEGFSEVLLSDLVVVVMFAGIFAVVVFVGGKVVVSGDKCTAVASFCTVVVVGIVAVVVVFVVDEEEVGIGSFVEELSKAVVSRLC